MMGLIAKINAILRRGFLAYFTDKGELIVKDTTSNIGEIRRVEQVGSHGIASKATSANCYAIILNKGGDLINNVSFLTDRRIKDINKIIKNGETLVYSDDLKSIISLLNGITIEHKTGNSKLKITADLLFENEQSTLTVDNGLSYQNTQSNFNINTHLSYQNTQSNLLLATNLMFDNLKLCFADIKIAPNNLPISPASLNLINDKIELIRQEFLKIII